MDMEEPRAIPFGREQRVAFRLDVAQPGADGEDPVGLPQPFAQRRVHPHIQIARIGGVPVVEVILPPEAQRHGHPFGLGKSRQRVGGGW